jgi:septum formation protein
MTLSVPLILASRSPRRRTLLERLGVSFDVVVSPADETLSGDPDPVEVARRLAARKVAPVADAHPSTLVLAADTVVAHDGRVLGKPADAEEARSMLHALSGQTHRVHTGLALAHRATGRQTTATETTAVTFASLAEREIEAYVRTGAPFDKAGGYGIQEGRSMLFVKHIAGDYFNVVGLPVQRLYTVLQDNFPDVLPG